MERKQLFEHLFPGSNYDKLVDSWVVNILYLYGALSFYDPFAGLGQALDRSEGFASRSDLMFLDKITFSVHTHGEYRLSDESPTRFTGWVNDLLKPHEKLGGVAYQQTSYIPEKYHDLHGRLVLGPSLVDFLTNGFRQSVRMTDLLRSFRTPVDIRLIGILNANNKPKGIMRLVPGPRPKDGQIIRQNVSLPTSIQPSLI